MSWDKGFNFRFTSGYVTDPANCTYVLGTETYPTTRNSVTFGWNDAFLGLADRDNTVDARLAGINYTLNGTNPETFRVDLPAPGTYLISLAIGDGLSSQNGATVIIKDTATTLLTIAESAAANVFYDAVDTPYSAANWPGSNTAQSLVFATSILNMVLDLGPGDAIGAVAHLFVSQVGSGPDTPSVTESVTTGEVANPNLRSFITVTE